MIPVYRKKFKKDSKLAKKQGKDIVLLYEVISLLIEDKILPFKYSDHKLKGEYKDCRDCHVKGDWIIIYQKINDELILIRTGSHSELFE